MFKRFLKKLLKESMLLRVQESNESFSAKFVLINFSVKVDLESYNFCCIFVQNSIDSSGTKSLGQLNLKLRDNLGVCFNGTNLDFLAFFAGSFNFSLIVSSLVDHFV